MKIGIVGGGYRSEDARPRAGASGSERRGDCPPEPPHPHQEGAGIPCVLGDAE